MTIFSSPRGYRRLCSIDPKEVPNNLVETPNWAQDLVPFDYFKFLFCLVNGDSFVPFAEGYAENIIVCISPASQHILAASNKCCRALSGAIARASQFVRLTVYNPR